ncbi:trans-2,3-enoyl-CoA reductase [Reticulomyxa filosa]|uniref:very-long-chain enoyl-CoA reductase n=1 Tax=Reticulomyxa filosa TaxID=46433 RepID=X6MCK1_RETFI|nr:trans-2,3-enoyl-CoA reductase [Reticulomyxa filosa]|eukprot:ETO11361.1 trans-2,3-enoyl-CoA reductase [Reticulomyxa filosa]
MVAHALPYYFPAFFYGAEHANFRKSLTQQVAFALVIFHYFKREFETAVIHRFSNETMPILNIFKNSGHYWGLGGIFISYFLYHPKFTQPFAEPTIIYGLAGLMVLCELGNLHAHYTLRNLRPPGTKERGIPKGQLFSLVSCANYTWEISSWFFFSILTSCFTSWVFLLVSFLQMLEWAFKKHRKYKQEFPDYPRRRKAILPFLL